MRLLVFLAVSFVYCQASVFVNAPLGRGCSYPNWKCDCNLVYNCAGDNEFPDDLDDSTVTGYVKDLAPPGYPLRISGKRWRRNLHTQEEFCKQECYSRMNAFLCLEEGEPSDYADSALCMKLLGIRDGPFLQDGMDEPCCEIYLQWGVSWCPDKWYSLIRNVRCLSLGIDASFGTSAPGATVSNVFSVEGDCTADGTLDFTWCDNAPTCPSGEQ